jgi:hypothetical protein
MHRQCQGDATSGGAVSARHLDEDIKVTCSTGTKRLVQVVSPVEGRRASPTRSTGTERIVRVVSAHRAQAASPARLTSTKRIVQVAPIARVASPVHVQIASALHARLVREEWYRDLPLCDSN